MTEAASGRFFYYVRPWQDGRWQVAFGLYGECFDFATEAEALTVALSAARRHWDERAEPSAVYQISPGFGRRIVDYFGV